jgi:hypothetical protein
MKVGQQFNFILTGLGLSVLRSWRRGQGCHMLLGHCSCLEYTPFEDKSDVLKDNFRGINY